MPREGEMPRSSDVAPSSIADALVAAIDTLANQCNDRDWTPEETKRLADAFRRGAKQRSPAPKVSGKARNPLKKREYPFVVKAPDDARILSVIFDPWPTTGGPATCPTCHQKLNT
jgi:hypothetical protein